MEPPIPVPAKMQPSELPFRTTALDCLKAKLQDGAQLLDYIPIDKVEFFEVDQTSPLMPCRIHAANVRIDNQKLKVWAYVLDKPCGDGFQDLRFYIQHADGTLTPYKCKYITSGNQWVDIFKVDLKQDTTVLTKCCFILKGVRMPADIMFNDRFLSVLKSACRLYKIGRHGERSSDDELFIKDAPPRTTYRGPMVARKTQQRSQSQQLFSLPSDSVAQAAPSLGTPKRIPKSIRSDTPSTARVATRKGREQPKTTSSIGKVRLTKPRANHVEQQNVKGTNVTMPAMSPNNSHSMALPIRDTVGSSMPIAQMTFGKTSANEKYLTTSTLPTSASLGNSSLLGESDSRLNASMAQRSSSVVDIKPGAPTLVKRELTDYRSLKNQIDDIDSMLRRLTVSKQKARHDHNKLCRQMVYKIDVTMQERHDLEKNQLARKQRDEATVEKNRLVEAKIKYNMAQGKLREEEDDLLRQKEELNDRRKALTKEMSHEGLIKALDEKDRSEPAHKRRKL